MSDRLLYFDSSTAVNAVRFPLDVHQLIADWSGLRTSMIRNVPAEFTRDEWAYLTTFLDPDNLNDVLRHAFGKESRDPAGAVQRLYRPRGPIAAWLPNNVSLLGPLTLVLLSMTGQRVRLKLGSDARDLAATFLEFAKSHLETGTLRDYLERSVKAEQFGREDERNADFARESSVRIVFGSDQAADEIEQLPHPADSTGFAFTDRRSEAWLENEALDDEVLSTLIKVFAIYGQAGCTSPRRVILLDGSAQDLAELRDRLLALWPEVVRGDVAMNVASANALAAQQARALGWKTTVAPRNAAVIVQGSLDLPPVESPMTLSLHTASRKEALAALPDNIQTIGHAVNDAKDPAWLELLADSPVLRFVPLGKVHYFSSSWDGQDFWRQCFQAMEISQ
jgi:hypothetical protein